MDKQDEDLNELRQELKKERKQHENTLRVTVSTTAKLLRVFDISSAYSLYVKSWIEIVLHLSRRRTEHRVLMKVFATR